jgi:hypothetical protein
MNAAFSLCNAWTALARGWEAFFHAPCDARVCALVRIGFSLVVLTHLSVLFPDRIRWFTEQGVLSAEASQQIASPYGWSLFWMLPGTPQVVTLCLGLAIANAVLLLVGLLPRLNALCLFLWLYSLQMRNPLIVDGEDTVMRMIAFFLIWMPSGQCWSLNALIRHWLGFPPAGLAAPGWSLRLLQIQMAAIFLSTGLLKLAGDEWVDGTALYYVSRLDDFFGRFPVPAWLFDTPWTVALMTWAVVLVELAVPLLIWFRETRRWCLLVTVLFHLANEWTMHLFLFHWIMLVGWLSFVTSDDLALLGLGSRIRVGRAS